MALVCYLCRPYNEQWTSNHIANRQGSGVSVPASAALTQMENMELKQPLKLEASLETGCCKEVQWLSRGLML